MYASLVFILSLTLTTAKDIHNVLQEGLCLCVADNDVYARTSPGPNYYVAGLLQENDCFVSNGGLYHEQGQTWYELKGINSQTAWVDSYHLRAKNATECHGATVIFGPLFCLDSGNIYTDGEEISKTGQQCRCHNGRVVCTVQAVG